MQLTFSPSDWQFIGVIFPAGEPAEAEGPWLEVDLRPGKVGYFQNCVHVCSLEAAVLSSRHDMLALTLGQSGVA